VILKKVQLIKLNIVIKTLMMILILMLIVKTLNNIVKYVVKMKQDLNIPLKDNHVSANVMVVVVKLVIGFGSLNKMQLKLD
jgi:hypothetical protein